MQLSTRNGFGTVSIVNGTNRVKATSALADWSPATAGLSRFGLVGDDAPEPWPIQALYPPDTPTPSGFWELDLNGIFTLPSVVGVAYAIHIDFTPNRQFPLENPSDVQRSQIYNRAMWLLDSLEVGAGGGAGILVPLSTLDIPTLELPKPSLWSKIAMIDGNDVLQWFLLQVGAPATNADTATTDDATSRWRQVG
jgi:hypothetical protein